MLEECPAILAAISPDLCTAVDRYCERTSAAIDAEPINALTNLAFLVAAWAAWRLHRRAPRSQAGGLISVLIANIAIVELGSFAFHTIATNWARWLDIGPIVLFMLLYLWFVLTHLLAWPRWIRVVALVVYGGLTLGLDGGGAGGGPAALRSLAARDPLRLAPAERGGALPPGQAGDSLRQEARGRVVVRQDVGFGSRATPSSFVTLVADTGHRSGDSRGSRHDAASPIGCERLQPERQHVASFPANSCCVYRLESPRIQECS